jgi:hypothetical protein
MPIQSPKKWRYFAALVISSLLLASCGAPATPNLQAQINAAVVATIMSIPTYTPYPVPTPVPSPTHLALDGLFCEYGFCIGHPTDVGLIDEGSTHKPPVPGSRANGIVFWYNDTLFIQLSWRISDPNFDPQTAMKLILEESQTFQGSLDALLIGEMNVYYQPTTTITSKLPYGGVATWQCGGRDFIWKVYTPQDNMAQELLKQSLERFRCEG